MKATANASCGREEDTDVIGATTEVHAWWSSFRDVHTTIACQNAKRIDAALEVVHASFHHDASIHCQGAARARAEGGGTAPRLFV